MNKTYNPCDECRYSYSKNNQEHPMCEICEFVYFRRELALKEKALALKEGTWLTDRFGLERSICSICKATYEGDGGNFCPNCGARMKGNK